MKLKSLFLAVLLLAPLASVAQDSAASGLSLPKWALKTNVAYWGTATPNLGIEVGLSRKLTLDVESGYNMFSFSKGKKWRHWMVTPELRWWMCDRFNGHFFGVHAIGGEYNVNRLGFNDHTKKIVMRAICWVADFPTDTTGCSASAGRWRPSWEWDTCTWTMTATIAGNVATMPATKYVTCLLSPVWEST